MLALLLLTVAVIGLVFNIIPFDNKYRVKQGQHRFSPIIFGVTFRKRWKLAVSFDPSCKYDIGSDQTDINKIFGVGYVSWKSILFVAKSIAQAIEKKDLRLIKKLHHYNSWRIGWWYDGYRVQVMYYCYVKGERRSGNITKANIFELKEVNIELWSRAVNFRDTTIVCDFKGIPIKLGGYFGGNRTAPHTMEYYFKVKA